ncbi:MAG: CT583 family protein [Chlamydiales bacterium]|nr:CT583 family protein [Chlamydiales bacterium]
MKSMNDIAKAFLKNTPKSSTIAPLVPMNSFRSLFEIDALSVEDTLRLKEMIPLIVEGDLKELSQLTSEVRSIQKQGIILVGERVQKVKMIFHKYPTREKLFTKWITFAFGSIKTAYNALAFYELYQELPDDQLKQKLKSMPAKTSYMLASRKGDVKDKISVIESYAGQTHDEIIETIQEKFPLKEDDKRKSEQQERMIKKIATITNYLTRSGKKFNKAEQGIILHIIDQLTNLIEN